MNPMPIWIAAVSLLSPFVTKAGEVLAQKAGETLFKALQDRFTKDKDNQGDQVLKQYGQDPELYENALAKLLERRATDKSFKAWLEQAVAETQKQGGTITQDAINQQVNVKGHGRTGDIISKVGGNYVKGK